MPRLVLTALLALALLPATAQAQAEDTIYESLSIPTVDGDRIHVEVARPKGVANAPVILTYSPYNSLSEGTSPNLAYDELGLRYLPKGYARAVADVLGTRNSSGCWDYGGRKEQQSGVDLVNALAAQPWANGKVAMIGGSYDGTTANMVAARGADAPGLAAIVPELAISRWYGYAYADGVRYLGNSERPSDEGFDTPFAFDFGIARTPPTQRTPQTIDAMRDRMNPCDSAEHTLKGYDSSPDYDGFWDERDYRKDAGSFRASTLVVHGWQDYNVRQSEGVDLYEALPLPDDRLGERALQAALPVPGRAPVAVRAAALRRAARRVLRHHAAGGGPRPGARGAGPDPGPDRGRRRASSARRPPGRPPARRSQRLALGRGLGRRHARRLRRRPGRVVHRPRHDHRGDGHARARRPSSRWLSYKSAPLAADTRIAGTPRLELSLVTDQDHGQLAPTLVDVAPDGTAKAISRGFLNLRYRNGLRDDEAVPPGVPVSATVTFSPQDHTVAKGHRIGLILAGSNTVWAVPDTPAGTTTTVRSGTLALPTAP